MKKIIKLAAIAALTTVSTLSFAAEKKPDVKVKSDPAVKIGSWAYQCDTVEIDSKKQSKVCALVQNFAVMAKDKKTEIPVLRLQVHKIKQDKKTVTFLGIRTPLGIDTASGMKLQIEKKDYKDTPFTTCYAEPLGCRGSYIIEGDLEKALLTGKTLRIGYRALDGRVIASEVKTDGFKKAVSKL